MKVFSMCACVCVCASLVSWEQTQTEKKQAGVCKGSTPLPLYHFLLCSPSRSGNCHTAKTSSIQSQRRWIGTHTHRSPPRTNKRAPILTPTHHRYTIWACQSALWIELNIKTQSAKRDQYFNAVLSHLDGWRQATKWRWWYSFSCGLGQPLLWAHYSLADVTIRDSVVQSNLMSGFAVVNSEQVKHLRSFALRWDMRGLRMDISVGWIPSWLITASASRKLRSPPHFSPLPTAPLRAHVYILQTV